ncbi:glycosyl transferase family 1 [Ktedonobacter sp. SOSP1-52]|uniref:glycosyltransferase n=1 Tax=Ktedonobacter sp. SOSP1-52 TaxID=2778366 RepID=UPI00191526DA|nr:glycosyltransferase [Ktedonobacter sp. SOSP1-52]GHO70391.1 glycosyl transferase family 1 [Ktedonobacter sp. SOSP1-52]
MRASSLLENFRAYVGNERITRLYEKAESLRGLRVLHLNTTATGGGVAEILSALTPITDTLGIIHTRKVVPLDEISGRFTTHLVDLLQNYEEPGNLSPDDARVFLDKLSHALSHTPELEADVYVVHDFQLVPLAQLFSWLRPASWFCHVDTARPNPHADHYIRRFLTEYELIIFNTPASILRDLPLEKTQVINLGIDPFRDKNRPLSYQEGGERIHRCGVDPQRPIITQVARFARWKNPWQAVDIYRLVKQQIPDVQLALVGAMEASDDMEAIKVMHEVEQYVGDDPDVHLLHNPASIGHLEVNAFQRYSSVILQRSQREGFGLTTTEAMWKYQPVIGTSSTGLRTQIIHEQNGYIADDTETSAYYALHLLRHPEDKASMGERAHAFVQQHFLIPMMLEDYLDMLLRVCQHCETRRPDTFTRVSGQLSGASPSREEILGNVTD